MGGAFANRIKGSQGKPINLEIRRGSETIKVAVQPTKKEGKSIFGERKDDWMIGIGSQGTIEKGKPGLAVVKAFTQTWDYIKITLLAFYKMIMGDVSPQEYRRTDSDRPDGRTAGARRGWQLSRISSPC